LVSLDKSLNTLHKERITALSVYGNGHLEKREKQIMKYNKFAPSYLDKFKPGDIAISKEHIHFAHNNEHRIGQEILVQEYTVHYYNTYHNLYDKKQPS